MKYYWVYVPEVNEAGCVVQADSFEDAFKKGCDEIFPDDGDEVQVHELGDSRSFVVEADPDLCHVCGEPTGPDVLCDCEREERRQYDA